MIIKVDFNSINPKSAIDLLFFYDYILLEKLVLVLLDTLLFYFSEEL